MSETQAVNWESRYQEGTARWERGRINPAFLAWREAGALQPCRILVPGAGRSPEPAALAEIGFDVTVVDVAPSAIAFQTAALPTGARVIQADLMEWQPDRPFDAIYEQTCLCALPPPLLPAYEQRLAAWLRPGGPLFALFMQTSREVGPPFDCPLDAMHRLFDAARWDWPATLPPQVPHNAPDIREQPAVLKRRPAVA